MKTGITNPNTNKKEIEKNLLQPDWSSQIKQTHCKEKHAYLIMAHQDTPVLRTLLKLIDDKRNDIFIHIDARTNFSSKKELEAIIQKSNIYFTDRTKVYWGSYTQIKAEYILFKAAYKKRYYRYYHLLSGADLPIKNQNEIHQFFDRHDGLEFIGFSKDAQEYKVRYVHLFSSHFREYGTHLLKLLSTIRRKYLAYQIHHHQYIYHDKDWEIKRGPNWVSITSDFVQELLNHENYFLKHFKHAYCADEIYKQMVAWHNPSIRERLYDTHDEFKGCMRLIDWDRGFPYTFTILDFNEILNSDKLFCRKICDKDLALKIEHYLTTHSKKG